tara:strand:+ start:316 stop:921 length:606 start_codon:yes stop_codon:yes gene_type:complete
MAKNLKNFRRDLNRVKISTLYSGPAKAAEKVVTELQEAGPSWTGLYSNSWQIEIEGQKSTGTRREGNPQPVKAPKLSTKAINSMANKTESVIIISNLARSRPYAQDEKLGRFRKGQVRNKFITNEPKYSTGKSKLKETGNMANSGRKGITRRGDIGGGSNLSQSSRTAPLDWFPTYVKGGRLPKVVKIELDRSIKQAQAGT